MLNSNQSDIVQFTEMIDPQLREASELWGIGRFCPRFPIAIAVGSPHLMND